MTQLALLRALASGGATITRQGAGLDADAPAGVLTPAVVAALTEHKVALLRLLDPIVIRVRFQVPVDQPMPAAQALVMVWLDAEREAFSAAEVQRWRTRAGERVGLGEPRYCAAVLAIEDVVRGRLSGDQRAGTAGAEVATGVAA